MNGNNKSNSYKAKIEYETGIEVYRLFGNAHTAYIEFYELWLMVPIQCKGKYRSVYTSKINFNGSDDV